MSSSSYSIGVDVGASKVVAGVVDRDGNVLYRVTRQQTPDSHSTSLVESLAHAVDGLRRSVPGVTAVGVGTAGLVRWPQGEIEFAANHGHRRLKLRRRLEERCDLPVVVENDANAAAWAEAQIGGDRGESLLFLSVGTGLGSGFIVDGELVRGHQGRGAELGHIVFDRTSPEQCGCGRLGCLEALASGRALQREAERLVRSSRGSRFAARVNHAEVTMFSILNAALDGDADVVALVRSMGRVLGRAIAENVLPLLPVDRVVVGGGLSVLGRLLHDPMRSACETSLARSKFLHAPRISAPACGPDATMIGAALLAAETECSPTLREGLLGSPDTVCT